MALSWVELTVIAVMVLVLALYVHSHWTEQVRVKSRVDGRAYLVRRLPDRQAASDYLARINERLQSLIQHMLAKYPGSEDAKRLYGNYKPEAISEGSASSGYTSYSVNKGEQLVLCIRQAQTHAFVDENVLMYVAIHELAHLMTKDVGHTQTFWDNFKLLLEEAIAMGLYRKVEFDKKSEEYCGIRITSSVI